MVAPPGWKLVPIEPTAEMVSAVTKNYNPHPSGTGWPAHITNIWKKMCAAAPAAGVKTSLENKNG